MVFTPDLPVPLPAPHKVGALLYLREPKNVHSLEHFEWFVGRCKLDDGRRGKLFQFQRELFAPYFAGVIETAIILPKKNGKSVIMALLALHHMIYEVDEPMSSSPLPLRIRRHESTSMPRA
jgi:hypothetical protein